MDEAIDTWYVDRGQSCFDEFFDDGRRLFGELGVKNDEFFPFLFIRDTAYCQRQDVFVPADDFVDFFLDLDVRYHFAADFGESAFSTGDVDITVGIDQSDIPGDVPTVVHDFGGQFGLIEITGHDVRSGDFDHSCLVRPENDRAVIERYGSGSNAWNWLADGSFSKAVVGLVGSSAVWGYVDGYDGAQFGRSVPFNGSHAESLFEGLG